MNGNIVLVPRDVAQVVGNLDPAFEHAMGDTDYALRARRLGIGVWVGPGVHGVCESNSSAGTFMDTSLSLRLRWKQMMSRKGLPWRSWMVLTRRHTGLLMAAVLQLALRETDTRLFPTPDGALTAPFMDAFCIKTRMKSSDFIPDAVAGSRPARVVIMQRRLTHYRVPLFAMMRDRLARAGIELAVVYGDPTPAESRQGRCRPLALGRACALHLSVQGTALLAERICGGSRRRPGCRDPGKQAAFQLCVCAHARQSEDGVLGAWTQFSGIERQFHGGALQALAADQVGLVVCVHRHERARCRGGGGLSRATASRC